MQTQTLGHISLLKYHSRSFWIVFHGLEEVRLQVWPFILCSVSRLSMQHLGQQPGSSSQAPATFLFAFSYWLQAAIALQSGPHREIETETLRHLHPYIMFRRWMSKRNQTFVWLSLLDPNILTDSLPHCLHSESWYFHSACLQVDRPYIFQDLEIFQWIYSYQSIKLTCLWTCSLAMPGSKYQFQNHNDRTENVCVNLKWV